MRCLVRCRVTCFTNTSLVATPVFMRVSAYESEVLSIFCKISQKALFLLHVLRCVKCEVIRLYNKKSAKHRKMFSTLGLLEFLTWYPDPGSNRDGLLHWCLRPARLPIPPSGLDKSSGLTSISGCKDTTFI